MKHNTWIIWKLRSELNKTSFTIDEALKIANILGINFSKEEFDLEQFKIGLNVELEHGNKSPKTNVTENDPVLTGKIALAHLMEFPDYYTRLTKLEEEAVAYCLKKGLEFYAVNSNYPEETPENKEPRKLKADLFIDDRNLGGLPDWGVIYQMISSGKHFDLESFFSPYPTNENGNTKKKWRPSLEALTIRTQKGSSANPLSKSSTRMCVNFCRTLLCLPYWCGANSIRRHPYGWAKSWKKK